MLAGGVAFVLNERLFHRGARRLRLSRRSGHLNLWSSLFNSTQTGWILVRDLGNEFSYYGLVEAYSDTADRAELLLREVTVHRSSTGAKLYSTERVYFARPCETLVIEPLAVKPSEGDATNGRAESGALPGGEGRSGGPERSARTSAPQLHAGAARDPIRREGPDRDRDAAVGEAPPRDAGDAEG